MTSIPVKVSIIEDSEIHAEWLKLELENDVTFQIISVDRYARKGIESIKQHQPDIVIIDFQLEDITGLETVRRVKAHHDKIRTFMITAHTEVSIIERMMRDKNVDALAIKGSSFFANQLTFAVKNVALGGFYLDPSLLSKLRENSKTNGLNDLTKREFEIFVQSGMGKSDSQISEDLCVELAYIKNVKSKIASKVKKQEIHCLLSKLVDNIQPNQFIVG